MSLCALSPCPRVPRPRARAACSRAKPSSWPLVHSELFQWEKHFSKGEDIPCPAVPARGDDAPQWGDCPTQVALSQMVGPSPSKLRPPVPSVWLLAGEPSLKTRRRSMSPRLCQPLHPNVLPHNPFSREVTAFRRCSRASVRLLCVMTPSVGDRVRPCLQSPRLPAPHGSPGMAEAHPGTSPCSSEMRCLVLLDAGSALPGTFRAATFTPSRGNKLPEGGWGLRRVRVINRKAGVPEAAAGAGQQRRGSVAGAGAHEGLR